jgi:uncharacterized surface protein with fasciclin (FAS1) repeats
MTNILSKVGLVTIGAILAVASYGLLVSTQVDAKGKPGATNGTIAEIALNDPKNFSTLVTALSCENLVGLVDGNRQLTVFAPTNAAFAGIGLNESNVCEADLSAYGGLGNILAYHVTPGVKTSKTVLNRTSMNMLNKEKAPIVGTTIGGAQLNLDLLNIRATNGIIHVVNGVLLP